MKKDQLLQALKLGDYKIKMESDCGCQVNWRLTDERLEPDIYSDACWVGNILYVNNDIIAEQLAFEEFREVNAGMSTIEFRNILEENDLEHIINEMQFDENDTENSSHEEKLGKTLIDFITDNDYQCYINYPRNFANEYSCILVDKNADIEDIPDDAEKIDAEEFAEKYLRSDDAVTEYYIGFEFID